MRLSWIIIIHEGGIPTNYVEETVQRVLCPRRGLGLSLVASRFQGLTAPEASQIYSRRGGIGEGSSKTWRYFGCLKYEFSSFLGPRMIRSNTSHVSWGICMILRGKNH